jgi:DNA-binding NarL/FixJ family response regulator
MKQQRILLIDDHPTVREGLKHAISDESDFTIVGEAASIHTALEVLGTTDADAIILDLSLPDGDGIDLLKKIKEGKDIPVLVLSMHSNIEYVIDSINAGASGYITKASETGLILNGLRSILEGGYVFDKSIVSLLLEKVSSSTENFSDNSDALYATLTMREQEIFRLLAEGNNVKEIAYNLDLSLGTVENYQTSIYKKLKIDSPTSLVRYAQNLGLI